MVDLAQILSHYGIYGNVVGTNQGPLITQIKFKPEIGTKIKTIENSLTDIAREAGFKNLRLSSFCEELIHARIHGHELGHERLKLAEFKRRIS